MKNNMRIRQLPALGGVAAVGALLCAPTPAQAQIQLFACFVPNSGVVYRVNPPLKPGESPNLKDDCTGKKHVKFSWGDVHASGKVIIGNTITIDDATSSITSTSGLISFGDENLVTSGTVESTSGGFKFPDGTVQATAAGGVSGHELVSTDAEIQAGEILRVLAICPSGKKVLGGGWNVFGPGNPDVVIRSSSPFFGDAIWQATFRNDHPFAEATGQAWAICATALP